MNDLNIICFVNDYCSTQILIIKTFDYDLYEINYAPMAFILSFIT